MAKVFLIIFAAIFAATSASGEQPDHLTQSLKAGHLRSGKEKLSHLRFFMHDTLSGPTPSAVIVARGIATSTSASHFGMVVVMDDPLTAGPEKSSRLVGRAQGMYTAAAQDTLGLLMTMNLVFMEGKYNGSSVAVAGRNQVFNPVREMPIVGGTGLFRFARGYVQVSTHSRDAKTTDAVLEYNCFILHY